MIKKVIIAGAGDIGESLIQALYTNYDVTVIEKNQTVAYKIEKKYDVRVIQGDIRDPEVLQKANLDTKSVFLAMTPDDQVNLASCHIAKSILNVSWTSARLRLKSYLSNEWRLSIQQIFDIDVCLSPEQDVVSSIFKSFEVPGAFDILWMAKRNLVLVGLHLSETFPFRDKALKDIQGFVPWFLCIQIMRQFKPILPKGETVLYVSDSVYFLIQTKDLNLFMDAFGYPPLIMPYKIFLIGTSLIARMLFEAFKKEGLENITVIDEDEEALKEMAMIDPEALLMKGHPLNPDLLAEANIFDATHLISVTKDDTMNILSCLMAGNYGVLHTIALIQKARAIDALFSMGIERMVHPSHVAIARILEKFTESYVAHFYPLEGENAFVICEVFIQKEAKALGQSLSYMQQIFKIWIIIRQEEILTQETRLQEQDRVILSLTFQEYSLFQKWFSPTYS